MRRGLLLGIAANVLWTPLGCAGFVVRAANLQEAPRGVRIFPPRVCLFVDGGEQKTTLAYLPDFRRAYDVRPITILAKQDFKIELDEGQLKALTSNQDPTSFVSLLKEGATLTAKAAGVGVSAQVLSGTFNLATGVHCMGDDGEFHALSEGSSAPSR